MNAISNMTSLGSCNARQAREYIIDILEAGLVPFLQSSPGSGKSTIIRSVTKDFNLKLLDNRLSTTAQEDFTGLPKFITLPNGQERARFAPFSDIFPLEGDEIPEGYQGWAIFYDEFNSAHEQIQAAAYKVILDRLIGQTPLHESVVQICAGNLSTDRAITTQMSTAMQSRLIHLEMRVDFQIWLEDVALKEGYDYRIIAFLSQYPGKLMDFRPDHNEKTFCCPRTWEFMNRLIKGKLFQEIEIDGTPHWSMVGKVPMYAGTITSGTATEFVQFCRVVQRIITVNQILSNPEACPLPDDNSLKWATITAMMEKVDDKNFGGLATYADRFEMNFRVLFYRSVLARHPKLKNHPAYAKAMLTLMKYLGD